MSNLKDLFISQSFYGIINLQNSTSPITSQSGDVELQDGIGTNLGLRTNADNKKFTVVNNFQVDGNADFNGDIDISGSFVHTGSIDVIGNVTVNGNINANIGTFDTVNTRLLHVTEESASVIFSSGSNVIGDEITDVQTIVGQTTISGSLGVTGTQTNIGNLSVSGEVSSSTVNGIGNVTTYSASVDSRLDALEGPFSTSVDSRLDSLETFETSQQARNSVLGTYTSSVDSSLASINSFTSSTQSSLNAINSFTSSQLTINSGYNSFTQSTDTVQTQQNNRLTSLETFTGSLVTNFVSTTDFNAYTSSNDSKVNNLISATGSYARKDTNNTFSGSINAEVTSLSIVSTTASMDCSQGNFFTLTLNSGTNRLETTNIQPGQTISLRVQQPAVGYGELTSSNDIKFPQNFDYVPTATVNSIDVISFISFDSNSLLAVSSNNLT